MRNFIRMLKYLKRRWGLFLLGLTVMLISTVFSGMSITMLYPVVDKLFSGKVDENIIYDSRPLTGQISEEFEKSIPGGSIFTDGYFGVFGSNLSVNFQNLLNRNHPLKVLGFLCIAFVIVFFFKDITFFYYTLIFGIIEERFSKDMRDELFARICQHSLPFFDKFRAGDLISRMISDIEMIKRVVVANLASFIYNMLQIIIFLSIAMFINFKLTLFTIIIIPPLGMILGFMAKKLRKYSLKSQTQVAGITSELEETVSSFKVVIAYVKQKFQFLKFSNETNKFYKSRKKIVKYTVLNRPVSEFLSAGIGLVLIWYGGSQVLASGSNFSGPAFAVFIGAMFSAFQPMRSIATVYSEWQKGLGVAQRYFELLDVEPDIKNAPNAVKFPGLKEQIAFNNVEFSFGTDKKILSNIDLKIKKGEVIALVGPSGGGKTTLTNLLLRFYDPLKGSVTYDSFNLKELDMNSVRERIGIVTQDTLLFHDTVFRNIAFGLPDIDPEKVHSAAKTANAHEFIEQLPDGYDTVIGEKGSRLSGGQKQRLAIARAILNDPEIIIFDEATSSLDSEAELLIQEAMAKVIQGRTVIMVAHRLSTIRQADRIIVVENGKIIEEGDHDSLMEAGGAYKRLHDIQFNDA